MYYAKLRAILGRARRSHRRPSVGRHSLPHCGRARSRARQESRPLSQEALLPTGQTSPMTEKFSKAYPEKKKMNSQFKCKKISNLPFVIADLLVALTALIVVPALLGDGTQHRDPSPPDVTVAGNFGRMFRNLPPFAPPNNAVRDALMELGSLGGILDANDDLAGGAVVLIADPIL